MSDGGEPELQRPFPIARIGAGTRFTVEADPDECSALALRMGVPVIYSLTCEFDLKRLPGDAVQAQGLLRARVQRSCVVSLDAFDTDILEHFAIRFVPHGSEQAEFDLESDDEVGYRGGTLELGEATSEQLALAFDPFPRMPGVELPKEAQDVEDSVFAGLGRLMPRH